MSRVTLKDVATHAGVSPSSVSRYINDPNSIKPIPALRIEKAIKELGYIPNIFARGLKSGHSNTIGIIVPGLGPFFSSMCSALSDFFYQHNYLLFICETHDEQETMQSHLDSLASQQVAGILVTPSGRNEENLLDTRLQNIPIVTLDRTNINLPYDFVYEEKKESSYKLTQHMIEKGHKQFLFLFQNESYNDTLDKREGVKKALNEYGLEFDKMYSEYNPAMKELSGIIEKRLIQHPKPTAILAFSPLYLETTLMSINKLKMQVLKDIDLAGYVLDDFLMKYNLELPCIIEDPYELGIQAGNLLLWRIRKGNSYSAKKEICVKPELYFP